MPIFGNDNPAIGDTDLPGNEGRSFVSRFELTEAGTLNHIALYSTSAGAGNFKGVLYADNAGAPGALIAAGAPTVCMENAFANSICAGQALTPGFYWIGTVLEDYLSSLRTAGGGGVGYANWAGGGSNYASPADPWVDGGPADYNVIAYADYTAGASDPAGSVNAALGGATLAATATIAIGATVTATLANATLTSTATMPHVGAVNRTLAATTLAAAGSIVRTAALTKALDASILAAVGELGDPPDETILAGLAATLADATLAGAGVLVVQGSVNVQLDATVLSAEGVSSIVASVSATLVGAALEAAAGTHNAGAVGAALDDTTLAAAASVSVTGTTSVTLGNTTLQAFGGGPVLGALSVTLDDTHLSAIGGGPVAGTPKYVVMPARISGVIIPARTSRLIIPKE